MPPRPATTKAPAPLRGARPKKAAAAGAKKPSKNPTTADQVNRIASYLFSLEDVPTFTREHYFAQGRRWAFDIAWPMLKIALEYEGNTWAVGGSRHTTGMGYRNDIDKYNHAAMLGWCVIRVTADMVRDLSYLDTLIPAIYSREG